MIDVAALRSLIVDAVRQGLREERESAPSELLTTSEAAKLAHVDGGTIRSWVLAGHLTRMTTGTAGHYRISRDELLAYLKREKARKTGEGVTPREAARLALVKGRTR